MNEGEYGTPNFADYAYKIGCYGNVHERSNKGVRSMIYDQISTIW